MDALSIEILGAHSKEEINARMECALKVVEYGIEQGDHQILKMGVDMVMQAYYRFDLLKQAERVTNSIAIKTEGVVYEPR